MRDILFRGKRTDNGEWVEGDLLHNDNDCFPMVLIGRVIMSRDKHTNVLSFDGFDLCEVIPETVGKFWGLKDKVGKRIFEGDVVKAWNTFHDKEGTFVVRWAEENGFYFTDESGTNWHHDHLVNFEVVGNVFDNSDLIEEGEK